MPFSRALKMAMILFALEAGRGAAGPELRVEGNRALSTERITELLGVSRDVPPVREDIERLLGEYYEKGYLFARVQLVARSDSETLTVLIDEGKKAVIGELSLRGVESFDRDEALRIMGIAQGAPLAWSSLERGVSKLLAEYDSRGYPFAQVWVESLSVNEARGSVGVDLFVMEGGKKLMGTVKFEGLRKTKPEVAVRLSGISPGEIYSGEKLEEARSRLLSSGIFTDVTVSKLSLSSDGGTVEPMLAVSERIKSSSASMAFGYADAEGDASRVLSGMASLDLDNIAGRLKDLYISWRNDGAGRNETEVRFSDRLFMGRSVSMSAALQQAGLDTLYTLQSAGLQAGIPMGAAGSHVVFMDLSLRADRSVFSQGALKRSWRLRAGLGARLTGGSRSSGVGLQAEGSLALAKKKQYHRSGSPENLWQLILRTGMEMNIDVGLARLDLLGRFEGVESSERFISLSEQFYLGGAATLRGYRENQFHGKRVGFLRSELRFGPDPEENVYIFVDGGYVLRVREDPEGGGSEEALLRTGYGFGVRTTSRLGTIDLAFAVGEKLSLRQTKVHVILGHDF